jgi:hypothetical protein
MSAGLMWGRQFGERTETLADVSIGVHVVRVVGEPGTVAGRFKEEPT